MFLHIIKNSKLIKNLQNICKYHKTRLIKTDIKLTALFLKLHCPDKGELNPFHTWIKYTKTFS